jgi:hypothetical protein
MVKQKSTCALAKTGSAPRAAGYEKSGRLHQGSRAGDRKTKIESETEDSQQLDTPSTGTRRTDQGPGYRMRNTASASGLGAWRKISDAYLLGKKIETTDWEA